jgi:hypothetical protein
MQFLDIWYLGTLVLSCNVCTVPSVTEMYHKVYRQTDGDIVRHHIALYITLCSDSKCKYATDWQPFRGIIVALETQLYAPVVS